MEAWKVKRFNADEILANDTRSLCINFILDTMATLILSYLLAWVTNMAKGVAYLGEFELIVMLSILRLGANAYGMRIWQEIEARTQRAAKIAAVYAALERLERKGYLTSWVADPTPARGGRAKRFFRIERKGYEAVRRSRKMFVSMWNGLDPILGRM